MLGSRVAQFFMKIAQNVATVVLLLGKMNIIQNRPKKKPNSWASFEKNVQELW